MAPLAAGLALLAAAPTWSVTVTRRVGVEPAKAEELIDGLAAAIDALPGAPLGRLVARSNVPDVSACGGAVDCVARLASGAGVERVVAVQLIKLGAEVALDVALIDGKEGVSLGSVTAQLPLAGAKKKLARIAEQLAAKVPSSAPPPTRTDPVVTQPPPTPPPEQLPDPAPEPEAGSSSLRYVSFGLGGAAVVAAVVAVGLGVVAMGKASAVPNTDPMFLQNRQAALGTALFSDVAWGVAAACAVAALVLFLVSG